jgi:hypothetical protein
MNYFLLLRGAKGIVLLYLFIVQGEGVCLDLFFLNSFTLEGEGGYKLMVFFLLHLTYGRRRGKGLVFFSKLFFRC